MQREESKFISDVEKEVREMGYDSCDEELSPLKWYLLLDRVQEKKSLESQKKVNSEKEAKK